MLLSAQALAISTLHDTPLQTLSPRLGSGEANGGGLRVVGNARVLIAGGSSIRANHAVCGAGLSLAGNASVNITGASSVQGSPEGSGIGGGVYLQNNSRVVVTDGSSII